jgi:hypothetical protein
MEMLGERDEAVPGIGVVGALVVFKLRRVDNELKKFYRKSRGNGSLKKCSGFFALAD